MRESVCVRERSMGKRLVLVSCGPLASQRLVSSGPLCTMEPWYILGGLGSLWKGERPDNTNKLDG